MIFKGYELINGSTISAIGWDTIDGTYLLKDYNTFSPVLSLDEGWLHRSRWKKYDFQVGDKVDLLIFSKLSGEYHWFIQFGQIIGENDDNWNHVNDKGETCNWPVNRIEAHSVIQWFHPIIPTLDKPIKRACEI